MPTVCFLEIISWVLETDTKVGYDYLWKGLVILVWLKFGGFNDDTEKLLQHRHYLLPCLLFQVQAIPGSAVA